MALSYELRHGGTKQGSSLTLTDYAMALSYKLHHSGTKQEPREFDASTHTHTDTGKQFFMPLYSGSVNLKKKKTRALGREDVDVDPFYSPGETSSPSHRHRLDACAE
ncbi:unnamed protein product [Timema podura]|uniref:Uncharacterized protein n=1 Tax=Timema podura TaxID=61482 RepID=A0ABN7NND0_TIMPD|nr:unnamed protein product [Timema podura]